MVMIDLNPSVKYKSCRKQVLQKMCREIYRYVPALRVREGDTLAANVMGRDSEIAFASYKCKNGNFVLEKDAEERSIFVEMYSDKGGKLTGDYLHSRKMQRQRSAERTTSRRIRGNNLSE